MPARLWILTLFYADWHLCSSTPSHHPILVVQMGQNASLSCNLTSSAEISWYLLRSDQVLPLLTLMSSALAGDMSNKHDESLTRLSWSGSVKSGQVSLEITGVKEEDAGRYFCVGRQGTKMYAGEGTQLVVKGLTEELVGDGHQQCWTLGVCVLPPLVVFCVVVLTGLCFWSGKPPVCCCDLSRWRCRLPVTEEEPLEYSSVIYKRKPGPSALSQPRIMDDCVTYSTVACGKNSK